jgi:hypothetical protein
MIPGAENISGAVKQTGPIFIGGHPKDAPASFGASVRRGGFFVSFVAGILHKWGMPP